MPSEEVRIPTDRLSDGEIRSLIRLYRDLANAPGLPTVYVAWYSTLALELHEALLGRDNRWIDITSDRSTWPPDWETAVAALDKPETV